MSEIENSVLAMEVAKDLGCDTLAQAVLSLKEQLKELEDRANLMFVEYQLSEQRHQDFVESMQKSDLPAGNLGCAFCGKQAPDGTTHEGIKEHIRYCEKHPLYQYAWQDRVADFHLAFNRPVRFYPTELDEKALVLRCKLLLEECMEYIHASGCEVGITDGKVYKIPEYEGPRSFPKAEGMIDALVDVIYIALGSAVEMGIDLTPFFMEVHAANMRKLDKNGKPILRKDGKVIKPPDWKGPDIAGLLDKARGIKGAV